MIQRVSASRLSCWKTCRRKYFLKYIEDLSPKKTGVALKTGSAVHAGARFILENIGGTWVWDDVEDAMTKAFFRDAEVMTPEDDLELSKALLAVESWYHHDPLELLGPSTKAYLIAAEGEFCVNAGYARRAIGFYDALIRIEGELWLVEHKTTSSLDAKFLTNLLKDEQASMYIYAARKEGFEVQGVLYNIMQKPRLRQKQNETADQFLSRIGDWYAEESRFLVHRVARNGAQMAEFEHDFIQALADMRRAERDGSYYRSPSVCKSSYFGCEYESLCLEDTPEAREGLFTERSKR